MSFNINIREAKLEDLVELQSLFVETIRATCKYDYTEEQITVWTSSVENKERWITFLKDQYFLIAEMDNKIVGFGSLDNGNHLDLLYVHKDYLRQGIASRLFEKLKMESERLGHSGLTSDVSKTARPFFEAKAFEVLKENKNQIKGVEIIIIPWRNKTDPSLPTEPLPSPSCSKFHGSKNSIHHRRHLGNWIGYR